MKVLFQSRSDLFRKRGGDTVQIEATKAALEKLGVEVDLSLRLAPDLSDYDLVHLFNLDWVCETYPQAVNARRQGKPIVLSAIHHRHAEVERWEREARFGVRRLVNQLLPFQPWRDMVKNVARAIFFPPKRWPTFKQLVMGIRRQQRRIIKLSDYILVQTKAEAKDIADDFGIRRFRWQKVVNGVEVERFLAADPRPFIEKYHLEDYLLCVGRIEPRKNQLSIIEAVRRLREGGVKTRRGEELKLVFIGDLSRRHPEYGWRFRRLGRGCDWVYHLGYLPHQDLPPAFAAAAVVISASWYETTGLTLLEAALTGRPTLVATGERAREYLGRAAEYADPGRVDSIAEAIRGALAQSLDPRLPKKVATDYTWSVCAQQTREVYKKLVKPSINR